MTVTKEQTDALKAPLNKAHVKQRAQAGRQLSYIEGWKAIDEANRIFGFGNWHRRTEEMRLLSEPAVVGDKWRVYYAAKVSIRVIAGDEYIDREGWGYGSGIDKDLGQAHESALKEAETDAMKRALMTFGNPFGLALYDKEQKNVVDEATAYVAIAKTDMKNATTAAELDDWWRAEGGNRREYGVVKDTPAFDDLAAAFKAAEEALQPKTEAA